jgi:hypothetical protein
MKSHLQVLWFILIIYSLINDAINKEQSYLLEYTAV